MARERWIGGNKGESEKVDAFIDEVIAVGKKHGMSISHQDGHGAFEIDVANEGNFGWLDSAGTTDELSLRLRREK